MVKLNYRKHELILSRKWILDATNYIHFWQQQQQQPQSTHCIRISLNLHATLRIFMPHPCVYVGLCVGKFFGCDKTEMLQNRETN